jgi:hypothetical protein
MAEVEKYTSEAVIVLMKHNNRQLKNDSNTDIKEDRSLLNYSIQLDHGKLSDKEYFEKILDETYIYGRGSSREEDAITAFSWVITLPKEISDYSDIDKSVVDYIDYDEENLFFKSAIDFVSHRYGSENVIHNQIHYDEAGQPHIHIYIVPRKELDHDLVHYKTLKTKEVIQTDSGRWEFNTRFKLDKNGERIVVKNYAKISDYYDTKLSCKEIINSVELKHFHPDFAAYLRDNNLPGANGVHTGITGGKNISVNAMKEFTRTTGLTIDEAKSLARNKEILEKKVISLHTDISSLQSEINLKNKYINTLKEQLHSIEQTLIKKDKEIEQLRKDKTINTEVSNGWGNTSNWGNTHDWESKERDEKAWTIDQE